MVGCIYIGISMMLGREKESVPEYLVDVYKSVSFIPSVINRKTGRDPSFPHSTL